MTPEADLAHCHAAIRTGSYSFHAASRLLPADVRDPAIALYAFCRLADDAVDEHRNKAAQALCLRDRLDLIYAGTPRNAPEDRAFARVVQACEMPKVLPEALLEGLAWDAAGRRYRTLSEVFDYSARVAAAVGAMMCVLMGVRDPRALARSCDMGVAMQLTNIARDVGEDARARRIYLPLEWMAEAGLDPECFFADPLPTAEVRAMVRRLLAEANRLYLRADPGIALLPMRARPGITTARLAYAGIIGAIRRNGHDTISFRARTGSLRKMGYMAEAVLLAAGGSVMPRSAVIYADPLPETRFLVEAAAGGRTGALPGWGEGRGGAVLEAFAALKARETRRGLESRGMEPS